MEKHEEIESGYLEILSKAKANCPVCETTLTNAQRKEIVAKKSAKIDELKAKMKETLVRSETAEKIVRLLERLQRTLERLAEIGETLATAKKRYQSAKKVLPQILKERKDRANEQKRLKKLIKQIQEQTELAEKFEEIAELSKTLKELRKVPVLLSKLEASISTLQNKEENYKTMMEKTYASIAVLQKEVGDLKKKMDEAKKWHEKLTQAQKKKNTTVEFAKEVKLASEAAKMALHELFENYKSMINSRLSWIWPILYPRPDLRDIQLDVKVEEIEEKGEKTLATSVQMTRPSIGKERIPFNMISSHGQRVLASIGFRVAFLSLLWKTSVPKILVLDEPTIWIDNRTREQLGTLLANLVKEVTEGGIKIDQVIVISHDPAFLNAIDPEGIKHVCVKDAEGFCKIELSEV